MYAFSFSESPGEKTGDADDNSMTNSQSVHETESRREIGTNSSKACMPRYQLGLRTR